MEKGRQEDEFFMRAAISEARKALSEEEVPIGAVVVASGRIVGRGHNLVETLRDSTAHAEMQALTAAMHAAGGKYLNECTLYVTVELRDVCGSCCLGAGGAYRIRDFRCEKGIFRGGRQAASSEDASDGRGTRRGVCRVDGGFFQKTAQVIFGVIAYFDNFACHAAGRRLPDFGRNDGGTHTQHT